MISDTTDTVRERIWTQEQSDLEIVFEVPNQKRGDALVGKFNNRR